MKLFLGIDLGTSYFKVGVFDEQGQTRGLGRLGVEPVAPVPGHAELPVDQFWRLLRAGVGTALKMAAATPSDIAGVSYSSQANTFVLLGKGDEPLTPFILWTDKRVAALDPDLVEFSCSVQFGEATGLME